MNSELRQLDNARKQAHPRRLGIRLSRHGRNLLGACPFHDPKEESLVFYDAMAIWRYRCLQCGVAGDLLDFVGRTQFVGLSPDKAQVQALSFWSGESARSLEENEDLRNSGEWRSEAGDRSRVLESFVRYCHFALERSELAGEKLRAKGWSVAQAIVYGIGYYSGDLDPYLDFCLMEGLERHQVTEYLGFLESWNASSLIFPARNSKRVLHNIFACELDSDNCRALVSVAVETPYNIQGEMENPILVPTIWDTLFADAHGVRGVMSLAGATLSLGHLYKLQACGAQTISLVLERNQDRRVTERIIERALALVDGTGLRFKSVILSKGSTVQTILAEGGAEAFRNLVDSTDPDSSQNRRRGSLLQEIKENYEDNMGRTPNDPIGYRLENFPRLCEFLDGVQPGYYLISAHPFGGKTSLLLNLAMDLVEHNPLKLIFVSLEMPRKQIFNRMVAWLARMGINEIQRRSTDELSNTRIQKSTMDLMGWVKADRLEIWDDNHVKDEQTLRRMLREEATQRRDLVVCIDGFYHLKIHGNYDGTEVHERRSEMVLDIYKELDIPVLCTGELVLRKELGESGKNNPALVDITGPRAYIRDPLVVMFLSGAVEGYTLTLAKNKVGGNPITIPLLGDAVGIRVQERSVS